MSTIEQAWKLYDDASPLVLHIDAKKGFPAIKQVTIKEMKYRKTLIEQMGLVKIEHVIEIRLGKKSAQFVFGQGMVSPSSPQAKRIKHLSSTEKIEATRRFSSNPANEKQIEQLFGLPQQNVAELIACMNTGKFSIVK